MDSADALPGKLGARRQARRARRPGPRRIACRRSTTSTRRGSRGSDDGTGLRIAGRVQSLQRARDRPAPRRCAGRARPLRRRRAGQDRGVGAGRLRAAARRDDDGRPDPALRRRRLSRCCHPRRDLALRLRGRPVRGRHPARPAGDEACPWSSGCSRPRTLSRRSLAPAEPVGNKGTEAA